MPPRLRRILLLITGLLILTYIASYWNKSSSSNTQQLRLPIPFSVHPNYPPPTRLMDLTDFQYLTNPEVCDPRHEVLAVVLVHTHPSHRELRQAARDHISSELLKEIGLRRVFLIGQATKDQPKYPAVSQNVIVEESASNNDLVQGNFIEHYRNLTYKHVMGLTWTSRYCPQTKFVIKTDDDIAIDLFQIRQLLQYKYRNIRNQMLGLVQIESHPLRTNASKWRVTKEEFQGNTYPPFLSGWCYIAPLHVVDKIVGESHTFPYFWIDDVLVTGIMAEKLGIEREGLNHKYTIHSEHLHCCTDEPYFPLEYYCDFIAGPTGGDHQLLGKALDQFRHCYWKGCQRRSSREMIARKCVSTPQNMPIGKGFGEVISLEVSVKSSGRISRNFLRTECDNRLFANGQLFVLNKL